MTFSSPVPFLWLNGAVTTADDAVIYSSDRGFLLGDGLYETFRFSDAKASHLDRHWTRLKRGCEILRLPCPEKSQIDDALTQLCTINQLEEGSARLTLTRGTGPRGLLPPERPNPTLILTIAPLPAAVPAPIRLCLSSYRRQSDSPLCQVKSINTLPSILARLEALEQNFDDALLLNERGTIAEGTASNFLALYQGQLVTPFIKEGALPGISRERLLEEELCTETSLSTADLPSLGGAWLVTALNLTPLCQIGKTMIPLSPDITTTLRRFLY